MRRGRLTGMLALAAVQGIGYAIDVHIGAAGSVTETHGHFADRFIGN
jgi:hypothetical protein